MGILGLTDEDLKKPTIIDIKEACVHDGKGGSAKVCVGDQVEVYEPNDKDHFILDYLGPGPYTIEWLAQWRCGRQFVQLTTPTKGKGKGVHAAYLKIVS